MKRGAKKKPEKGEKGPPKGGGLYTLEVALVAGLVTEQFVEKNPVVSRTIQIRGDQTLDDLHYAIFDAFDEHMYEFQFGKKPQDRKAKRYVLPMALEDVFGGLPGEEEEPPQEDLTQTTIASLGLKPRQSFWYWFDFGDDWWHSIKVKAIEEEVPKGKYPKVTERVGESPPQYMNWDEEEDEEDEGEDDDEE